MWLKKKTGVPSFPPSLYVRHTSAYQHLHTQCLFPWLWKTSLAFVFTMERATIIRRDANQMDVAASLYLSVSFLFHFPFSPNPFFPGLSQSGERDKDRLALADFFGSKRLAQQTVLLPQPWLCLEKWSLLLVAWSNARACIGGRIRSKKRKERKEKKEMAPSQMHIRPDNPIHVPISLKLGSSLFSLYVFHRTKGAPASCQSIRPCCVLSLSFFCELLSGTQKK